MDDTESWNPEPPPEIVNINKDDLIGDTLFSKHWLFEVLLKLIKKVEEVSANEEMETNGNDEVTVFEELDPDFEKDLCDLWDMSVQKDVVLVLNEFNSIQIFQGFICRFNDKYPRAIEILIGIMVNMATLNSEISFKIVQNHVLVNFLIFDILVKMADVPSVIQVILLFTVFVSTAKKQDTLNNDDSVQAVFLGNLKKYFRDNETSLSLHEQNGIFPTLNFILEQSLNSTLLDSTCNFILQLIDNDEEILTEFASDSKFVDALCNAAQTRFNLERSRRSSTGNLETPSTSVRHNLNKDEPKPKLSTQESQEDISTIDCLFNSYFLCMQTLSTCELGAHSLFSRADSVVVKTFDDYLDKCLSTFNDWEIKSSHSLKASVVSESLENLVCLISVLNCIIPDQLEDSQARLLDLNAKFGSFFLKLFTLCKYYLIMFGEIKKLNDGDKEAAATIDEATSESNDDQFSLARSSMREFFKNVVGLRETSNSTVNRLIDECISLLDDD